jgi:hypothetical protein
MVGIMVLGVFLVWSVVAWWLSCWVTGKLLGQDLKYVASIPLLIPMLFLPVADEVVGALQMKRLCRETEEFVVHVSDPVGRTVRRISKDENVSGTAIPMTRTTFTYIDAESRERVISYMWLSAEAGLFIRYIGISQGNKPLVGESSCPRLYAASAESRYKLIEVK